MSPAALVMFTAPFGLLITFLSLRIMSGGACGVLKASTGLPGTTNCALCGL